MQPDDIVCHCFQVSRRKLEKFVRLERPRRESQMSECFGAGTGCGWCRPILRELFRIGTTPGNSADECLAGDGPDAEASIPLAAGTVGRERRESERADDESLLGLSPEAARRLRDRYLESRRGADPGG